MRQGFAFSFKNIYFRKMKDFRSFGNVFNVSRDVWQLKKEDIFYDDKRESRVVSMKHEAFFFFEMLKSTISTYKADISFLRFSNLIKLYFIY